MVIFYLYLCGQLNKDIKQRKSKQWNGLSGQEKFPIFVDYLRHNVEHNNVGDFIVN